MEPRVNINDLIVVEQLPIIVQHLRGVKANAEREVQDALSLALSPSPKNGHKIGEKS